MDTTISIHLGTDARVSVPDRADAYLEIEGRGSTLDLFLGENDHDRIEVIDRLAEALLEIRVRCMAHLVTIDAGVPEVTESEARLMDGNR